jgi:hypothetical protein
MPRVAQLGDRVFFGLCALAGVLILVGSLLPAFELYLNASTGTGEAQRFLEYERELRLVTYLESDTLLFPLVGAAFVVLGAAGTVMPRSWMAVTALLLTIPAYVQWVRVWDYADASHRPGIYLCDEPELEGCIAFFAPAVREFRADVLRRPEAREPGYEGPTRYDFSVEPLSGWRLVAWTVLTISLVVWFRAILVTVPRPWLALPVFLVVVFVIALATVAWSLRNYE